MKHLPFFLLAVLLFGCYAKEPQKTGHEGKALPEFSFLLTDSITYFNTGAIPAGKPVVLFYFSPHCPYCRAQVDEIIEDIDKLKNIQFYMITSFPLPEMKHFYQEFQLSKYPNITMGRDTTNFLADYFEVTGVPYMAIYGKDKKLRKAFMGKLYGKQIEEEAMN